MNIVLGASHGQMSNTRRYVVPERKAIRISFDVDAGNEALSELRLLLEAQGKPVSETWLYRWTP